MDLFQLDFLRIQPNVMKLLHNIGHHETFTYVYMFTFGYTPSMDIYVLKIQRNLYVHKFFHCEVTTYHISKPA